MTDQTDGSSRDMQTQQGDSGFRPTPAHLRRLLDHAADAMFLASANDGRILEVNRQSCESLGYDREELLSLRVADVDVDARDLAELRQFWAGIEPGKPVTTEGTHRRKDGSTFPAEIRCDKLEIDGTVFVLGLARNITERRLTEAALRESEQGLRSLYASMSEGLCLHELICDSAGEPIDYRILEVNPAYEKILGLSRDEVIGKLASVQYGAGEAPFLQEFAQVVRTGHPIAFESFFAPLGKHFSISVFRPSPGRFGTVFLDVTERKQVEAERERLIAELESKNAELERFAYTVSHDLKSPLITVKGYLGLLAEDIAVGDADGIEDDLRRLLSAADTMDRLLGELLELSRIGRIVNQATEIDLGDLVEEALGLVAGRIVEGTVEVNVAPDLPNIFGDRQRMLEVLQNLIDNAAKYMGCQSRPTIWIGAEAREAEILLHVRDNGMGIPEQYHEKIFGLFNQLDQKSEGTGVGLALVKRIVEVHQGRIWVESLGGQKGTTFFVALPQGT